MLYSVKGELIHMEPQMAVILGGGRTIGYDDILETIRIDY